jgi:hypothetical protein
LANSTINDFDKQAVIRKNYFDFIMDSMYGLPSEAVANGGIIRGKYNIPDELKMVIKTNEEEGFFDPNLYSKYLNLFIGGGVLKFTGMSFKEFLEMPMYDALIIVQECKKYVDTEMSALNKANANMAASIKDIGKVR